MPLPKRFFREAALTTGSILFLFAGGWYFAAKSDAGAMWILVASAILFALFVVAILMLALKPRKLERHLDEDLRRGESGEFYLVGAPLSLFCSFVLTSFCLWRIHGESFYTGADGSLLTWFVYLLDNLVWAAALDFAESYHLDVSGVDHTKHVVVCTLVFAFRATVSVALISILFRTWTMLRTRRLARSTANES